MQVNPESLRILIKEIKRPKSSDTLTINSVKFPMKPVKSFLNTLKDHSYSLNLEGNHLHCYYQNKKSTGIVKFIGYLSLTVLLASCASGYHSYTDSKWHNDKIECPKDFIYNIYRNTCVYSLPPVPSQTLLSPKSAVKLKHKHEPINCVKLLSKLKGCGYAN